MGKHRNRNVDLNKVAYASGYGKPPKHGQFKPGHKRSAKGTKRKPKETTLDDILNEKVAVPQKDGMVVRMTNREVVYRQIVSHARKGVPRHVLMVLEHDRRMTAGEADLDPLSFDADLQKAVLADFVAEIEANSALRKKKG